MATIFLPLEKLQLLNANSWSLEVQESRLSCLLSLERASRWEQVTMEIMVSTNRKPPATWNRPQWEQVAMAIMFSTYRKPPAA